MSNQDLTPLQRAQREHDKKRAESRKGSTKQVRFKDAVELALFDALLEQSGDSAVGVLRKWMAMMLVV